MIPIIVLSVALSAGEPPDSVLLRTRAALAATRGDLHEIAASAEAAAERLAGGGALYAAGDAAWISELSGRAGGMMLVQGLGGNTAGPGDVVLLFDNGAGPAPADLAASGALVVAFAESAPADTAQHVQLQGSACAISPRLSAAIAGWVYTGELVAALTRRGKMPVMFASIGIYGGYPRIYEYQKRGVFWHEKHDVPPVEAGVFGGAYIDAVTAILERVEAEQRPLLEQAAEWSAQAGRDGRQLVMFSMGHLFPAEVGETEIGRTFESAVWNSGFFNWTPPAREYHQGDVLIHIGYQHPPYRLLEQARPHGARVVYVDLYRHRDYADDPDVLWIDPMWPWVDAVVAVPNYDIPILPPSGVLNAAIAWEIFRLTQAGS